MAKEGYSRVIIHKGKFEGYPTFSEAVRQRLKLPPYGHLDDEYIHSLMYDDDVDARSDLDLLAVVDELGLEKSVADGTLSIEEIPTIALDSAYISINDEHNEYLHWSIADAMVNEIKKMPNIDDLNLSEAVSILKSLQAIAQFHTSAESFPDFAKVELSTYGNNDIPSFPAGEVNIDIF